MNRRQKRANLKEFEKTKSHRVKKGIIKVLKELEEESESNN